MNDYSEHRNNNGAIVGFLVGAIVGAGAALLLAPRSGEETRRQIGDTARRVGQNARGKYDDVKGRLAQGVTEVKDRLAQGVTEVKDDLHDAVEAGKSSAQRLASRIPGDTTRNLNG